MPEASRHAQGAAKATAESGSTAPRHMPKAATEWQPRASIVERRAMGTDLSLGRCPQSPGRIPR
eukprot:10363129-Alexandrium_andersonii.AAC.1